MPNTKPPLLPDRPTTSDIMFVLQLTKMLFPPFIDTTPRISNHHRPHISIHTIDDQSPTRNTPKIVTFLRPYFSKAIGRKRLTRKETRQPRRGTAATMKEIPFWRIQSLEMRPSQIRKKAMSPLTKLELTLAPQQARQQVQNQTLQSQSLALATYPWPQASSLMIDTATLFQLMLHMNTTLPNTPPLTATHPITKN